VRAVIRTLIRAGKEERVLIIKHMALELLAAVVVVGAHLLVEEEEEMATIMIRQTAIVATTTDTCPKIGALVWRGISRALCVPFPPDSVFFSSCLSNSWVTEFTVCIYLIELCVAAVEELLPFFC